VELVHEEVMLLDVVRILLSLATGLLRLGVCLFGVYPEYLFEVPDVLLENVVALPLLECFNDILDL
jgi:hypothetical protein